MILLKIKFITYVTTQFILCTTYNLSYLFEGLYFFTFQLCSIIIQTATSFRSKVNLKQPSPLLSLLIQKNHQALANTHTHTMNVVCVFLQRCVKISPSLLLVKIIITNLEELSIQHVVTTSRGAASRRLLSHSSEKRNERADDSECWKSERQSCCCSTHSFV